MPERDYYNILKLDPNASHADIRRSFRQLALRYHPDQNPDDPHASEKFKVITEAYKVLINPKTRANYDRVRRAPQTQRDRAGGHARRHGGASRHPSPPPDPKSSPSAKTSSSDDAEDQHTRRPWWQEEELSRAPRTSPPPPPPPESIMVDGSDNEADMTISQEVANFGSRQPIAVARYENCAVCNGTGAKPDTVVRQCPECDPRHPSPTCPLCTGRGHLFEIACSTCFGRGKTRVAKTFVVTVPPHSRTGQKIRIPGEGMPSSGGGKPGDLVVRLVVKAISEYEQRDASVYSEIHVTPQTAAMGGMVRVKTVDGAADLVIPPGTKSGAVFRLEGKGPILQGRERGDHFVTVKVVAP
jgi:molecular chaperone DnaJ